MSPSKSHFLSLHGADYGYPAAPISIDDLRATDFNRLRDLVYLDHAGAALYSDSQIAAVAADLTSTLYANPHSQSDASSATADLIAAARRQVLEYCNADAREYRCVFTAGATAALKLVGEGFPWSGESWYVYTRENHNSVLGIREYALDKGASALAIDIEDVTQCSRDQETDNTSIRVLKHSVQRRVEAKSPKEFLNDKPAGNAYNLFAFPSECNFSGMKYNLNLVNIIKQDSGKILEGSLSHKGRWKVLIDAAKGCATEPPDLARYPADFVVLSFYKIFGYPTGLGALLVRNEAASVLNTTYFSGGTVSASIADIDFVKRREPIEQLLEDGTQSFLSIASLRHGFKIINTLTISSIARHTRSLATYVRNMMLELKHDNGVEVCTIYGSDSSKVAAADMGPTIAFNLRRADGSWFGYREVEQLASLSGIQLRTGCFCNPGACAKYLGLSHSDLLSNIEAGHVCWDDYDILNGKPTGAVRISFGYMSAFEDAEKFLKFVETSFIVKTNLFDSRDQLSTQPFPDVGEKHLVWDVQLKSIIVYPVKSCSGFSVCSWPLGKSGLRYDREWLLKGSDGEILTQKKIPKLCYIHAFIDLGQGKLYLESPLCRQKLQISLQPNSSCGLKEDMKVYGQRYEVHIYDDEVNLWFTEAIGRPCTFVRCLSSDSLHCTDKGDKGLCRDMRSNLTFVNEAPLLLISEDSVSDLNKRINSNVEKVKSGLEQSVDVMRFRPNLVISGAEPYAEDRWNSLYIGNSYFKSIGGCNRCQMINLEQKAGQVRKSNEPLATLASYRRLQGKILFGILLRHESVDIENGEDSVKENWLKVGQDVYPSVDEICTTKQPRKCR